LRCVIIAVLALLLVFVSVSVYDRETIYTPSDNKDLVMDARYQYVDIGVLNTLAAIISTVIPILELLPFKSKRNMDTMLFLPIERRKMAAVHFINGFAHVFLINLICFTAAFFILIAHSAMFAPWSIPLLFAVNLLGSFIVYSVTAFIFDRANTTADGIVWLVIYSFIGLVIFASVREIYGNVTGTFSYPRRYDILSESCMSPYSVLLFLCNGIERYLFSRITYIKSGNSVEILSAYNNKIDTHYINSAFLWAALAIACAFGFIWLFKNKRPENIGAISSSPFGYKVLLPVTAIAVINCEADDISLVAIMLVTMIVGYIIYRRSIRLKLLDYISMAIGILVPLAFELINSIY
jgi:hypothetical protein